MRIRQSRAGTVHSAWLCISVVGMLRLYVMFRAAGNESQHPFVQKSLGQPLCICCLQKHRAMAVGVHVFGPRQSRQKHRLCLLLGSGQHSQSQDLYSLQDMT